MRLLRMVAVALVASGCASVKVVRVDPAKVNAAYGDADRTQTSGVLFYRPRPYLMVTQGPPAKELPPDAGGGTAKPETEKAAPAPVTPTLNVQIIWLPDYSQEYEIQAHPGIGSVTMNPTLKDGWNLAGLSATVDSKTAELITAATGLAKAIPFRAVPAGQKTFCTGLYPIDMDRTSGLITGVGQPVVVFEDRSQCLPLR